MPAREKLRENLRLLAGLRPQSPTDEELDLIIGAIIELAGKRRPTSTDWKNAAAEFVPNAGKYRHAGDDQVDLNVLLVQVLADRHAFLVHP